MAGTDADHGLQAALAEQIRLSREWLAGHGLRLGESSSHLACLPSVVRDGLPDACLVLPLRHPVDGLVSALGRNKWSEWFGNEDGRCRYSNGGDVYCSSAGVDGLWGFVDRWLILWAATWSGLLELVGGHRGPVHPLRLDRLHLDSARELSARLNLPLDPRLLAARWPRLNRNSAFDPCSDSRREQCTRVARAEISPPVLSLLADVLNRAEASRLWEADTVLAGHALSAKEWNEWTIRLSGPSQ